mmetsp:Transcript_136202/g.322732  ORF Transcript_136202/g.322732 Transcript_136202/m.322732 type:complete len:138 (-) Transcript_136202:553-966(-)
MSTSTATTLGVCELGVLSYTTRSLRHAWSGGIRQRFGSGLFDGDGFQLSKMLAGICVSAGTRKTPLCLIGWRVLGLSVCRGCRGLTPFFFDGFPGPPGPVEPVERACSRTLAKLQRLGESCRSCGNFRFRTGGSGPL